MALPCSTASHYLHYRRDYCFSAFATVGLNSRWLGVVCFKIRSGLPLFLSLFHWLSSAPLATSGGGEVSCRGETGDRRRLCPRWRTLAPVRIVALLAFPQLDFSTVLSEGHPLVCIPVVASTPPSSPSSLGTILTKQLPALSPRPSYPAHFLRRLCKYLHLWLRYFFELLWRGSERRRLGKEHRREARMDKADEGWWIRTAGFQLYAEPTLRKRLRL